MTRKRNDTHSTEFGLWLREQSEIDSKLGFTATNIDFLWRYMGNWMFLEEKRYGKKPRAFQIRDFRMVDKQCRGAPNYHGFHLVVFENTNPDDGRMRWDRKLISKKDLFELLRFEKSPEWYQSSI